MEILSNEVNKLNTDWKDIILELLPNKEFSKEVENLNELNKCYYPNDAHIFRCFNYFNIKETKIVILGQDPYHGEEQAIGLCFGTCNKKIPPSLKNIEKELLSDLDKELRDYSLEHWAKQGVLLLNTSLSVCENKAGSHMKIWSNFTENIIKYISENNEKVVFVAWGAFAYDKLKLIDKEKHNLIVTSHPSPLSNYKKYKEYPAFKGSNIFSNINKILLNKIDF